MKEKSRILEKADSDKSRPVSFRDSFGGSESQLRLLLKYLPDESFKDINLILNSTNYDLLEKNKINILVATTVIEVGMDIPEASLMIIENPERLGLAQLHQLRGRVGRKANTDSNCLLLYKDPLSPLAQERISTMEKTNDGFEIAEKDLELRGGGDIHGLKQSGLMNLKIANPVRDSDLLESAQKEAFSIAKNNKSQAKILIDRWIGTGQDYSDA